jgi:ferritin
VAIHVTTAPSEALIRKCKANIEIGLRPIIVTIEEGRAGIESIAKVFEIEGRIDVIEAEQFIATNILELSNFAEKAQKEEIERLINRYNKIVEEKETDPSLKIQI